MNGPLLLFRLLALRPHIEKYSQQHVEHLEALELLDFHALKAVHEVLALARDTKGMLDAEHIPIMSRALKYP